MAQQMILAAQKRRNTQDAAEAMGFVQQGGRRRGKLDAKQGALRQALAQQRERLTQLFDLWDEDGNGEIDEKEFRRALRMLGLKPAPQDFTAFMALADGDGSGSIDLEELKELLDNTPPLEGPPPSPPRAWPIRICSMVYQFFASTAVQTFIYFIFVLVFQMLLDCLRMKQEYFLDKALSDKFIDNHYDKHLNSFKSMRRIPEIWEWGNDVLLPGLLGNNGPDCGDVGLAGYFNSSTSGNASSDLSFKGGCNDHVWPDGDGLFSLKGGSAWTVQEMAERFDAMDWTSGVAIWQRRIDPTECVGSTGQISDRCFPEFDDPLAVEGVEPFGYNWTHPSAPLDHPFRPYTADELGSNPNGQLSAHPSSYRGIPAGGYSSFIIPFFSDTLLPEQRGTSSEVIDYRSTAATRDNSKTAAFFCVRLSWDGELLHQICDPNAPDPDGGPDRTTGVVRAAVEEFWNDLKRAHYIDAQTRVLIITITFVSNNVGVATKARFIIELLSTSATLPSYDVKTRVIRPDKEANALLLAHVALAICTFFVVFEFVEIVQLGLLGYFSNMWNLMDWINFVLFFMTWLTLMRYFSLDPGCSLICENVGFVEDWQPFDTYARAKTYLSMCVCIQLLKTTKFLTVLVPKLDLAPIVLKKALPDLVFFMAVFGISLVAFSTMFYVQLGPVMVGFNDQIASFLSLGRALFGDFSIDEILENDTGYLNSVLFLMYLFVVVFIMLSMFFAILGENQANLRDEQHEARKAGAEPMGDGYGILAVAYSKLRHGLKKMPGAGGVANLLEQAEAMEEARQEEKREASPLDRIEARQLELSDKVDEIFMKIMTPQTDDGAEAPPVDVHVLKSIEELKESLRSFAESPTRSRKRRDADNSSPSRRRVLKSDKYGEKRGGSFPVAETSPVLVAENDKLVERPAAKGNAARAQSSGNGGSRRNDGGAVCWEV